MSQIPAGAPSAPRLLALGRLLRLSLAPSAAADIAAGLLLVAGAIPSPARTLSVMLASLCVYHGGMALNDWADREEDARGGRPRPIPTGALSPAVALGLASLLLGLGPLLALAVAPRAGLVLLGVAALAVLYDLAGRGAWRGPLLLALCRAGNLGTGMALASGAASWRPAALLAPAAYGLYVFLVSRLARLEDVEPGSRSASHPARWTVAGAAALIAIGAAATLLARQARPSAWAPSGAWAVALTVTAAIGLLRYVGAQRGRPWTPVMIQRAAGMALRRLLIATSALAAGAGTSTGLLVAVAILAGYPVSLALRRLFPPT